MVAGEPADADVRHRGIGPAEVDHGIAQIAVPDVARRVGEFELSCQEVAVIDLAGADGAHSRQALDEQAGRPVIDPSENLAAVRVQVVPIERRGRTAEIRIAVGEGEADAAPGVPVARTDLERERCRLVVDRQLRPAREAAGRFSTRVAATRTHQAIQRRLGRDEGRIRIGPWVRQILFRDVRPLRLIERNIGPLRVVARILGASISAGQRGEHDQQCCGELEARHERFLSRTRQTRSEVLSIGCRDDGLLRQR